MWQVCSFGQVLMFLLKSCLLYPFPWKISEFSPTSILLVVKSALLDRVNTIRVPLVGTEAHCLKTGVQVSASDGQGWNPSSAMCLLCDWRVA